MGIPTKEQATEFAVNLPEIYRRVILAFLTPDRSMIRDEEIAPTHINAGVHGEGCTAVRFTHDHVMCALARLRKAGLLHRVKGDPTRRWYRLSKAGRVIANEFVIERPKFDVPDLPKPPWL